MTDKEMVKYLLNKVNCEIYYEDEHYIEANNGYYREPLSFEFDNEENIKDFY